MGTDMKPTNVSKAMGSSIPDLYHMERLIIALPTMIMVM